MRTLLPAEPAGPAFEWYRRMRASAPVSHDAAAGYWQVFRYDDVLQIASDHATFSSAGWEARRRAIGREERVGFSPTIVSMDPPRHRQLRSLVTQAFTPRAVAQLAPRITQIAHELLDQVTPSGAMDVMDDLAGPLPITVIAELLGVPATDRAIFKQWSDALLAGDGDTDGDTDGATRGAGAGAAAAPGSRSDEQRAAADRAAREMRSYFATILAERRARPQNDLIGGLLAAEVDGQRLSEDDLLGFCMLLLVAGNITTTNLLGNAMVCFDEHPEQFAHLREEPRLARGAIEEVLRYRPPARMLVRTATSDTTIADQRIRRGDAIVAWIASANHDEARFPEPERFDICREPNPHLAFGHGIHFCIGAPLARLEGKIALEAMLERLPGLKRACGRPAEPLGSPILWGVKHFHVTFDRPM